MNKEFLIMPTLEFKGKQFVYSHHLSVPFRELKVVPEKSLPAKGQKLRWTITLLSTATIWRR
jgi:hypothetical protein